jgi:hypothetical protein
MPQAPRLASLKANTFAYCHELVDHEHNMHGSMARRVQTSLCSSCAHQRTCFSASSIFVPCGSWPAPRSAMVRGLLGACLSAAGAAATATVSSPSVRRHWPENSCPTSAPTQCAATRRSRARADASRRRRKTSEFKVLFYGYGNPGDARIQ